MRLTFFASPKKVSKEKRPLLFTSLRLRLRATCATQPMLRAPQLTSRFQRFVQTRGRESVHRCVCVLRHSRRSMAWMSQAWTQGVRNRIASL